MKKQHLKSFSLHDLTAYLRSEDWILKGSYPDEALVFEKDSLPLLVPLRDNFSDYYVRISDAVHTISKFEQRSELGVIRDLQAAGSDTFRLRLSSPEISHGNVTLAQGATLFEATKIIVQSAARSADAPKPFFRARPSQRTDDYLKKVKLGQTEIGSYIVNVMFPVIPDLQEALPSMENDIAVPFDRKVSLQLTSGLNALEYGIQQQLTSPSASHFTNAINKGVNANLCDALVIIGESINDATINTSMSWARTRSRPTVQTRSHFKEDDFSYIAEASRQLRNQSWDEKMTLIGNVTKLVSEKQLDGGEVIVKATINDSRRNIKLFLNPDLYSIAIEAHKQYRDIEFTGIIEQVGSAISSNCVQELSILKSDCT